MDVHKLLRLGRDLCDANHAPRRELAVSPKANEHNEVSHSALLLRPKQSKLTQREDIALRHQCCS